MRRPFEQQQRRLQDKVLVLGSQTEELLRDSVAALVRQDDADRAIFLLKTGRQLSRNCVDAETDALALLATQQPMAGDLRFLAAVFQISLELGRVANHAGEIARISLKLGRSRYADALLHFDHLAESTLKMFHHALGAFAERDAILARAIAVQDDEIDDLYSFINQHLRAISRMAPHLVDQTLFISQAAHELERVGDRSTNICEWVLYAVTGELVETNVEAYERIH